MILSNVHIGNSVFKIDEDAKNILDSYRNALYEHLKSFNNSTIIIKEIEYKLSELLLPCIDNEFDFLTEDDVKQAILIIGLPDGYSIPNSNDNSAQVNASIYNETVMTISEKIKSLYRDIDRQQIGGVAAGIADSLNTDPLWVRLSMILPVFFLGTTKAPLIIISLLYLTGWLLLPEKRNIHRDDKTRIFFRDKENKIFGGVASGLSNYLGIDLNWIRLGLIVSTYFINEFILIYAIIWIVTPYSRSLKDKFQSKGLQFNLTEIESYLTKTFENTNISSKYIQDIYNNIDKDKFNRVNPFLLKVLKGLSFLLGALLFTITITLVFSAIPILGVSLKVIPLHSLFNYISTDLANEVLLENDFNLLNTIQYSIPNTTAVISALHFTTLSIFLFILSTSLMSFKKTVNNSILLGLFVSNVVFSILLLTALNMSVHNFDNQATHKEEVVLPINEEALHFKLEELGNIPLNESKIYIKGYNGDKLKLVFMQEALGKTREKAIINAKAIDYTSKIVGNTITLGSHFSFPRGVKYRMQKLKLFIYIPQGQFFTIDQKIQNKIEEQDIEFSEFNRNKYLIFDNNDICHSIDKVDAQQIQKQIAVTQQINTNHASSHVIHAPADTGHNMIFKLEGLDTLHIYGNLDVNLDVEKNRKYSVISINSNDYKVKSINGIMKIYPTNEEDETIHKLTIKAPSSIAKVKFNGKGLISLKDNYTDSLECDFSGNINADLDINTDFLYTIVEGVSSVDIKGESKKAFVLANDGSQINGKNFTTQEVKAKAKGVSKIVITAKQNATIFQSPLSKVTVLGDPLHYEKHTQR